MKLRHVVRKENSIKGLIFGDRHNNLDPPSAITGVSTGNDAKDDDDSTDDHVNRPDELESDDRNEGEASANDSGSDDDVSTGVAQENNIEENNIEDDSNSTGVAIENRDDEFPPPDDDDEFPPPDDDDSNSDNDDAAPVTTTRSGRVSKPYDYANNFPDLYGDTNLTLTDDALCLRPYYTDFPQTYDRHTQLHTVELAIAVEIYSVIFLLVYANIKI